MIERHWIGQPPSHCDLCKVEIKEVFIDGRTQYGPWASMCEKCHEDQGGMLGTGLGQKYVYAEGVYKKVAG